MFSNLIVKLISIFFYIFAVTFLPFSLMRFAPGHPFMGNPNMAALWDKLMESHGLKRSIWDQYKDYMTSLFHGDLGVSYYYNQKSVLEILMGSLSHTFFIVMWSAIFCISISFLLITMVQIFGKKVRNFVIVFTNLGISFPSLILGPMVIIFLSPEDLISFQEIHSLLDYALPGFVLGLSYTAMLTQILLTEFDEMTRQGFWRAAHARGFGNLRLLKHALVPGALPGLVWLGPTLIDMFAAAITVEIVFRIPGFGRFFLKSSLDRDYPVIMATVIFVGISIPIINILIDKLCKNLDPRLKEERKIAF